ncbi:MAG TPA: hypothetical protein VGK74_00310 [Symbiobacteriaceae bacterium]|jgi:outer membrane lipoprotein-sorting protein
MQEQKRDETVARVLKHHIEQGVPDDVDLWPAIQRRLAERQAAAGTGPAEAAPPMKAEPRPTPESAPRWWPRFRLASVAAVAVLALTAVYVWTVRPPAVSAAEIVGKVWDAASMPAVTGLRSFAMTESEGRNAPYEIKRWYQAPDQFRIEVRAPAPGGRMTTLVSDGQTVWSYDQADNRLTITGSWFRQGQAGLTYVGAHVSSLPALLEQVGECYNPVITGTGTVAGRAVYVIDMGLPVCPTKSVSPPGRSVLWVDKQTYFVLKDEYYDAAGKLAGRREVTALAYDAALDPGLFTFQPPAGTLVYDQRPQTNNQAAQQLSTLAAQAEYPLFAPQAVPAGMAPQAPRLTPTGIDLDYAPAAEAGQEPVPHGVALHLRKATRSDAVRPKPTDEPVVIGPLIGWYSPGVVLADGTGGTAVVTLVRDGTRVSLSSHDLSKADLVSMALSLAPVPGGHAPLDNPGAWTHAELRTRLAYPIRMPATPAGLTPGAPTGGEQPADVIHVDYRTFDGRPALLVVNGPAGCCLDADGRKTGESVPLPGGLTGHYLSIQPEYGGPILWWDQDGTYVALSGPDLHKDDLLKIAATVSR